MKIEKLNYKECREKIACLLDKKSIISKTEIVKALNLNTDLWFDDLRFHSFLNHIRKYALEEYSKSISERIPISNIINLNFILSKNIVNISEFIKFCEVERIPLLYYIPKIKKYIFPNELLLSLIYNRLSLISEKLLLKTIKKGESKGYVKNIDDIFELIPKNPDEEDEGDLYLKALIRKKYIFGEETKEMFNRMKFTKKLKKLNNRIEKNLYSIADLELKE